MIDADDDLYDNYQFPVLHVGMRVRLRAPGPGLRLRSNTGHVLRETQDDGYYVIRLDRPALYDHGVGAPEDLLDVVAASDNLDVVPES